MRFIPHFVVFIVFFAYFTEYFMILIQKCYKVAESFILKCRIVTQNSCKMAKLLSNVQTNGYKSFQMLTAQLVITCFFSMQTQWIKASSASEVVIIVFKYYRSFSGPMKIGDPVNIVFGRWCVQYLKLLEKFLIYYKSRKIN